MALGDCKMWNNWQNLKKTSIFTCFTQVQRCNLTTAACHNSINHNSESENHKNSPISQLVNNFFLHPLPISHCVCLQLDGESRANSSSRFHCRTRADTLPNFACTAVTSRCRAWKSDESLSRVLSRRSAALCFLLVGSYGVGAGRMSDSKEDIQEHMVQRMGPFRGPTCYKQEATVLTKGGENFGSLRNQNCHHYKRFNA